MRRFWYGLLCATLALYLGTGSAPARAGKPSPRDPAQLAQPLLAKGVAALKAGDFATATQALTAAYRQSRRPEALLQLARLAQGEHRGLDAYDLYHRYLADPTRVPDEAAAKEAEQAVAVPPPVTGSLTVLDPPGALLLLDSRVVGVVPLPLPLLLAPGDHTLVIEANRRRFDTPVRILAGRHSVVRTGQSSGALLISILPAMLVVDKWTGVPVEVQRAFADRVERTALGQQMGVMPATIAATQAPELQSCLDTQPCQQKLTQKNQLDYLLYSQVKRVGDGAQSAWEFILTLVHAEISEPASTATLSCASCTSEQAVARYQEALTQMLPPGLARPAVAVQVLSQPPGAEAILTEGARPLGKTPLHLTLWAGRYNLALRLAGYKLAEPSLAVEAGSSEPVTVPLVPEPEPEPATASEPAPTDSKLLWVRERPRWRFITGGVALGLGINLLAGGLLSVSLNEKICASTDQSVLFADPKNCPNVYNTTNLSAVTIGVGLAFGIGGVVLLAVPGKPTQVPIPAPGENSE